jgi:hypothetical protein
MALFTKDIATMDELKPRSDQLLVGAVGTRT